MTLYLVLLGVHLGVEFQLAVDRFGLSALGQAFFRSELAFQRATTVSHCRLQRARETPKNEVFANRH
jgi:hypothetical protein